jgi:hypothetical protein
MTPDIVRDWVFGALAVLALAAWLYGADLLAALRNPQTFSAQKATREVTDPRTYVATAVAALVGGVAAVYLGVQAKEEAEAIASAWTWADGIRLAYVVIYALFGAAAIVAWVRNRDGTPLSVKNLAVTFIGLMMPAVGGFLGAP